jgi:hypothetical protein
MHARNHFLIIAWDADEVIEKRVVERLRKITNFKEGL